MTTFRNRQGFSLIELLVVIAIIGILVIIGIPNYNEYKSKAASAEAKTMLVAIHGAQEIFHTEFHGYHSNFAAIGFSPLGKIRYNTGFGDVGELSEPPKHGFAAQMDPSRINTKAICGGHGNGSDVNCEQIEYAPDLEPILTVSTNSYFAGASRLGKLANKAKESNSWSLAKALLQATPAYASGTQQGMEIWIINHEKKIIRVDEDLEYYCREGKGRMSVLCGKWGEGYNGD